MSQNIPTNVETEIHDENIPTAEQLSQNSIAGASLNGDFEDSDGHDRDASQNTLATVDNEEIILGNITFYISYNYVKGGLNIFFVHDKK